MAKGMTYKGIAIKPGTDAEIAAQVAKIDGAQNAPTSRSYSSLLGNASNIVAQIKSDLASGKIDQATATAQLSQVQGGVDQIQKMSGASGATLANPAPTPTPTPTPTSATGNATLDSILASVGELIKSNKAVIPPGLQVTPALTQAFLQWAHQSVDPQTKQLIDSEVTNINASNANLAQQYELSKQNEIQNFGTTLATEQNTAGGSGTAFSGLRGLTERNLANTTNRNIASLGANAAANIGQGLRTAAANVGSANAGGITPYSISGGNVGIEGGSRGNFTGGAGLDLSYNPSLYQAGNIPSSQYGKVNDLAANYLSQYGTLAGANSGRSMKDLIGMVGGLPSGYQIPSTIQ